MIKKQIIDPPFEEFTKLKNLVEEHSAIAATIRDFEELHAKAKSEVDNFISGGDLRDEKSLSSIVVKQLQTALVERKLAGLGDELATAEQAVSEELPTMKRMVDVAFNELRNGAVEEAAQAMRPHFERIEQCRRNAVNCEQAKLVSGRRSVLNFQEMNGGDPLELANTYIEMAPGLFEEVETVKKKLGGVIPSSAEMQAF